MNHEFLRERAQALRAIADTADPFTEKRLLDLAKRYEDNIARGQRRRADGSRGT